MDYLTVHMKIGRSEQSQMVKVQAEHTVLDIKQELVNMGAFRKLYRGKDKDEVSAEQLLWIVDGDELKDDEIPDRNAKHFLAWKKASEMKRPVKKVEREEPAVDEDAQPLVKRSRGCVMKDWQLPHIAINTHEEYEDCQKAYKRANSAAKYARSKGEMAAADLHTETQTLLSQKMSEYISKNKKGVASLVESANERDKGLAVKIGNDITKLICGIADRSTNVVNAFVDAGVTPQAPLPAMPSNPFAGGQLGWPGMMSPFQMSPYGPFQMMPYGAPQMMQPGSPMLTINPQMLMQGFMGSAPSTGGGPMIVPQPTTPLPPLQPPTGP